jgi:hypothetical protein
VKKYLIPLLHRKASYLDHLSPDKVDHQKPELNTCVLEMYVKNDLTGQMWSRHSAFATKPYFNNIG